MSQVKLFKDFNELLFPNRCIACGVLGIAICSTCRIGWNPHIFTTKISHEKKPPLKVTSSIIYSTIAQKVILAAKESHIRKADELVSGAIVHAISHTLKEEWIDYLIPIPSRSSAVRKRGRQFIEEMVEESANRFSIPVITPLSHSRSVRDQSGLHHTQRWNNLDGAFVVKESQQFLGKALLVDDLVTTGATLIEAARALNHAGIEVIGAVTAAIAQPLRLSR